MIHTKDELLKYLLYTDDGEIIVGIHTGIDISDELSTLLKHNLISELDQNPQRCDQT